MYPKVNISPEDKIWKRWHDPDRLLNEENFESLRRSSDIYSLGLLFWEIAWCGPEKFPFKGIQIRNLYNHLRAGHYEKLPDIPKEYRSWERLIKKMWLFKPGDRYEIITVESTLRKFFKGRSESVSSMSSISSSATFSSGISISSSRVVYNPFDRL